jgi:hypothetical protein
VRALAIAALLLGGCTLFDDRPDRSCRTTNDCFESQGERCNMDTHTCEIPPDAGALEQADEPVLDVECEEAADE